MGREQEELKQQSREVHIPFGDGSRLLSHTIVLWGHGIPIFRSPVERIFLCAHILSVLLLVVLLLHNLILGPVAHKFGCCVSDTGFIIMVLLHFYVLYCTQL